jgi:hypothetical protein
MVFIGIAIVLGITAVLWLEFREIERRVRLVKNIEAVLKSEDIVRQEEVQFKRAA